AAAGTHTIARSIGPGAADTDATHGRPSTDSARAAAAGLTAWIGPGKPARRRLATIARPMLPSRRDAPITATERRSKNTRTPADAEDLLVAALRVGRDQADVGHEVELGVVRELLHRELALGAEEAVAVRLLTEQREVRGEPRLVVGPDRPDHHRAAVFQDHGL